MDFHQGAQSEAHLLRLLSAACPTNSNTQECNIYTQFEGSILTLVFT